MTAGPSKNQEWLEHLPSLDELTTKSSSNTLLRPFSRFSISSLFRSTPSLPQSTLLVPFLNVDSLLDDVQQASRTPPSTQDLTKWLLSLRDYINQLKEAVPHHKLSRGDPEIQDRITTLTDAFLGAIRLLARELWGSNDETNGDYPSSSRLSDSATFGDCVRDILQAVFYFRQDIHDHDGSTYILDQHILGSIFPPEQTRYDRLAPILAHPRTLVASLQHHPTRPLASSKLKSNAFLTSPVAPFIPLDVSEDEVQRALELLNILIEGVEMIDHLPGPVTAKNKNHREEDNRRPIRVAMEAKVLRCDLLLSMTTRNISQVKSRAAARYTTPLIDEEGKEAAVAEQVEDTGTAAQSGSKARLSEEDGSECTNNDIVQPRSPFSEAFDAIHNIKWEDKAEDALVECLIAARHMLEEGRPEVLSLEVQAVDWLGPEGIVSPKQETLEAQKSKSPSRDLRFSDLTSDSEQDQSDLDSEDEEETSEDGSIDIGGSSQIYPLKALFRLHDRYEEQRLAVWLHLPASKREKMGSFMCGLEGRVGSAWDGFGLALMMVYDSATLIRHGLGADKLDKWIELAAAKNTKKVRRKPARKTI